MHNVAESGKLKVGKSIIQFEVPWEHNKKLFFRSKQKVKSFHCYAKGKRTNEAWQK